MTTDLLADLIADARQIVLPQPRVVERPQPARPPVDVVRIPEPAVSLLEGYADYGA
ncbi:MAG TPA: hypothetical protein VFJ98_02555 [Mycobacteriales bacterium]|nr:hypothetical protein [Mycobacteriales bacterium]